MPQEGLKQDSVARQTLGINRARYYLKTAAYCIANNQPNKPAALFSIDPASTHTHYNCFTIPGYRDFTI